MKNGTRGAVVLALFMGAFPGCSGDGGDPMVDADPEIALSLSPTNATVEQGGSVDVTGTVVRTDFAGALGFSVTGAPAGVTTTVVSQNTVGSTTTVTISLEVGEGVLPGLHTLTARATGSGVADATATFTLTVTAAPSFELSLSPAALGIERDSEADVEVTIERTNFDGAVTLSLEGPDPAPPAGPALGPLPTGVSAVLSPNPATGSSATLTLEIGPGTTATLHDLTLRGSAAGFDDRTAPLALTVRPPAAPNIVFEPTEIAVGTSHACRLDASGAAFCWGFDVFGQLGDDPANAIQPSPVAVAGGHAFDWIASGDNHACGLDDNGQAYCWGEDSQGQLGNDAAPVHHRTPAQVAGNTTFAALSAKANNTCGLDEAGYAWCWGDESSGQLGDGVLADDRPEPHFVSGGIAFGAISVGGLHTCGLDLLGQAHCWGNDGFGELGNDAPRSNAAGPVPVSGGHTFVQITTGGRHTCALDAQGQAYCWGSDVFGQLGNGPGSPDQCGANACALDPEPIQGHVFASLVAGAEHTCGLDPVGNAYCWGQDTPEGQLGDDTSLVDQDAPVPVAGGHLFRELAASTRNTCGVDTNGDAWCWGDDSREQLGNGDVGGSIDQPTPVQVDHLP